jgi:hypothetical protein
VLRVVGKGTRIVLVPLPPAVLGVRQDQMGDDLHSNARNILTCRDSRGALSGSTSQGAIRRLVTAGPVPMFLRGG